MNSERKFLNFFLKSTTFWQNHLWNTLNTIYKTARTRHTDAQTSYRIREMTTSAQIASEIQANTIRRIVASQSFGRIKLSQNVDAN